MRFAALLLLWPLAATSQTAADESSALQGRVLNAVTGEPVAKVALVLIRTDSPAWDSSRNYAAVSDAAGKFAILHIDPGKYRLRASRNGFVPLEYGARDTQRPGTVLDLEPAHPPKDIEFRLTPHGVIAGRVLDVDGEPLSGVLVQLLRSQYVNGRKTLSTIKIANTNDLGEYRWAGLTPGRYFLYAENMEGLPPTSTAREEYVPMYYPGASNSAGAIPLDVAAGAQLGAADMMLRKAPTTSVRGRVVVELPDAQSAPSVRFAPSVGHNNSAAGTFRSLPAKVDAAGRFEIRGLTPGTYTAMAEVSKGGRSFAGHTMVDVGGSPVEGIVIKIGSGITMTGRIRVDDEAALNPQSLIIRLRRGGPTVDSLLLGWTYKVAPDRAFRIENLDPERYGISIDGLPDGFYIRSIRHGEADITYTGVDLTSGAAASVDILVSPKAARISGAVQNADTGVTVVLVPKEKERVPVPAFYRDTATRQQGGFTFASVPPGEYKIYAWEDVEPGAWLDPEFLKTFEDKGESVTVGESAQASVQVTLIPAAKQ